MHFWPPDDEHMCSKYVEAWNKLIVKQQFCASSWLITKINILRCKVNKTSKFLYVIYIGTRFVTVYMIHFCTTVSVFSCSDSCIAVTKWSCKCINRSSLCHLVLCSPLKRRFYQVLIFKACECIKLGCDILLIMLMFPTYKKLAWSIVLVILMARI